MDDRCQGAGKGRVLVGGDNELITGKGSGKKQVSRNAPDCVPDSRGEKERINRAPI